MEPERQLPRLRQSLKVRLSDGWAGEAVDLSATGLRVRSLVMLEEGSEISCTLTVPDGAEVPLSGRVVWVNPPEFAGGLPGEFGVELLEVPEAYLSLLAGFFADAD